jgi:hypothetical protein
VQAWLLENADSTRQLLEWHESAVVPELRAREGVLQEQRRREEEEARRRHAEELERQRREEEELRKWRAEELERKQQRRVSLGLFFLPSSLGRGRKRGVLRGEGVCG